MAKKTTQQPTNRSSDYVQIVNPQGYVNNMEVTNLPDYYLTKGSQNILIKNAQKTMTRKGYILKGVAKTVNNGIHSWFDWVTNSQETLSLRNWSKTMEVWYYGAWRAVSSAMTGNKVRFTTFWKSAELLDVLLFVENKSVVNEWSGGITKVASVTSNTIKKQGYVSGTDFSFSDNGASPDTILQVSAGFVTAGFAVGDTITVQGSTSNDGNYTISAVTDGVLTVDKNDSLTTEAAGDAVVVKWLKGGTWAEARFFTINDGNSADRAVTIEGAKYVYTGGEGTGTLTGVTPDPTAASPAIANGAIAMQTIRVHSVKIASTDQMTGYYCDLISMQNNYVFYGSSTSRVVLISKASDFADAAYTSPLRKPGEGFTVNIDSCPTAFAPAGDQQTINKSGLMTVFAGKDDEYQITFTLSSDLAAESISIFKPKTGSGMAARSQECVATIRNAILFLTFEPTLEMLGKMPLGVDTPTSKPLSDLIRDDIENYDLTGASMLYNQRNLYIAIPKESIWLIYDFQNLYWQPPQRGSFSGFAHIDGVLCAHSAYTNETYELFNGYNDNGKPMSCVAAYGYDNYGMRFGLKSFNEHATELYISKNTKVTKTINYEYRGSIAQRSFIIDGSLESVNFLPKSTATIGSHKMGENPIGSSLYPLSETTDGYIGMGKMRLVQSTTTLDFFERQVIFSSSEIDDRFMIIAFGENVEISDNIPGFIKDPTNSTQQFLQTGSDGVNISSGRTRGWVFDYVPTETVDGTNRVFTIPASATQVIVMADGARVEAPAVYSFSGVTVTFVAGQQPFSSISIDYKA